jgi:hypothetical protein
MALIGYTFSNSRKEVVEESDAYLTEHVEIYKTLKGCVNALKRYLKDEELLDKVSWYQNMEAFMKDAEGTSWKHGFQIAWVGQKFWDNHGFFIKCVFMKDDPGEICDHEYETDE